MSQKYEITGTIKLIADTQTFGSDCQKRLVSGSSERLVRPSHGGYVGHLIVKVLCESRQWMQGSAITESDSMSEAAEKQRRYDQLNAPFDEANAKSAATGSERNDHE